MQADLFTGQRWMQSWLGLKIGNCWSAFQAGMTGLAYAMPIHVSKFSGCGVTGSWYAQSMQLAPASRT